MSRLKTITFSTDAGGIQQLTVQDYSKETTYESYGSPNDEALDASLRQNIRGQRESFRVTYRLSGDPDTFMDIANNIATDLQNGNEFVYVGIDSDSLVRVTLDGDFAYKVEYANQHGLFIPSINMKAYELGSTDQISVVFEDWRFITEAVDDSRDYDLITESVTTQIDYGSI